MNFTCVQKKQGIKELGQIGGGKTGATELELNLFLYDPWLPISSHSA